MILYFFSSLFAWKSSRLSLTFCVQAGAMVGAGGTKPLSCFEGLVGRFHFFSWGVRGLRFGESLLLSLSLSLLAIVYGLRASFLSGLGREIVFLGRIE